jgi:FMN-dependent NADH-azoreductase
MMDSQEPHLRSLFGFMGVAATFVRAERLAFGPEVREKAIDAARAQLTEVIGKEFFEAA